MLSGSNKTSILTDTVVPTPPDEPTPNSTTLLAKFQESPSSATLKFRKQPFLRVEYALQVCAVKYAPQVCAADSENKRKLFHPVSLSQKFGSCSWRTTAKASCCVDFMSFMSWNLQLSLGDRLVLELPITVLPLPCRGHGIVYQPFVGGAQPIPESDESGKFIYGDGFMFTPQYTVASSTANTIASHSNGSTEDGITRSNGSTENGTTKHWSPRTCPNY